MLSGREKATFIARGKAGGWSFGIVRTERSGLRSPL
jgi:hypothetical protein